MQNFKGKNMQFKLGDKLRIIGTVHFNDRAKADIGKIATVVDITTESDGECVGIKVEGSNNFWIIRQRSYIGFELLKGQQLEFSFMYGN